MAAHKHIDKICCIAVALSLLLTVLFINGEALGIAVSDLQMGYESRLFDTSRVHTVDIVMEDWDSFIETCENEEYALCSAVIDGEAYENIGIRAKGNTSLSSVSAMNSHRYSFKIEFDQYDSTKSYHGLDKLSLNNLIQDNTFLKDYLVYEMMRLAGAAAPLCSFAYITVNGADWGLYLALEGVEDAFLQRNYGNDHGELYKPDSMSFGGGRGNGRNFSMDDLAAEDFGSGTMRGSASDEAAAFPEMPDGRMPFVEKGGFGSQGGMEGGAGSSDVKLQYIDDDPESYSNIFNNAKTDVTEADQERLIAALKTLSHGENKAAAVDAEAVIRYFVVHNFAVNGDSYTGSMIHNYYLYEKDGVLSMLPWDYNLAFGTFQGNRAADAVNDPIDSPVSGGSMEDRPMAAWIFEDEAYTALYHEYFAQFIRNVFDSGVFESMVDSVSSLITPYVEKDPTKFCTLEEFEAGVAAIKTFCLLRAESVKGQLNGTIPSTAQGQAADNCMPVDTGSLDLSAMGTMGKGMGGGKGGFTPPESFDAAPENGETALPDGTTVPNIPAVPDGAALPDGMQPPDSMMPPTGMMPGGMGGFERPFQGQTNAQTEQNGEISPRQPMPGGGSMKPFSEMPAGEGGFARPDGNAVSGSGAASIVMLGVCAAVLMGGIAFALCFKRRKP